MQSGMGNAPGKDTRLNSWHFQAEQAALHSRIEQSEKSFRLLFEHSSDGLLVVDPLLNRFVIANPSICRMLGYGEKELTELKVEEIYLPEDRRKPVELFQQHVCKETDSTREISLRRKDGSIFHACMNILTITVNGRECRMARFRDGLHYAGTNEAARQRLNLQDQLAKINATVPGMIFSFKMNSDGTTCMPYSNARIYELFGFLPEEVSDDFSPALERIHPADISHVWESITESARTLKPWRNEFRVCHPEKGERWIDGFSLPRRQADGGILWHGFAYDITGFKRSEERLNRFIAASPAVLYVMEAGEIGLEMTWISENLYPITGWTPAESLDIKSWWKNIIHPEDRDRILDLHSLPYGVGQQPMEYRILQKDGTYLWIRDEKRLLPGIDGKPDEIVGAWVDISERIQLENQLRHAQKMEALGQMAGAVAHDFNNILSTILGFTSLLLSEPETGDAQRTYITEIREAGERATALVRQLLTFSRKQESNPRITDLETVVKGIERMLHRLIGNHIILAMSFESNTPSVKVDPGQMEQVVINLAMNAADSMVDAGTLTIDIGPEELDEKYCSRHPESRPGCYTVLSIADTGAGIPPEILGRIFEPFFTTKDAGKGTGLGLAIISGIVKQSNGFIQVESVVGTGTTVRIFLPALNTLKVSPC